jgi:hypothetical protein
MASVFACLSVSLRSIHQRQGRDKLPEATGLIVTGR